MMSTGTAQRASEATAYVVELLAAKPAEGVLAGDMEAAIQARCGGTKRANRLLLARLVRRGVVFAKRGTVRADIWRIRFFDTQAAHDACPVFERYTPEEIRLMRRDHMRELRRQAKEANPAPQRNEPAAVGKKPAHCVPVGEPIITERTKVTIIPARADYRYHVDAGHRGELMADWQSKRGKAVTC